MRWAKGLRWLAAALGLLLLLALTLALVYGWSALPRTSGEIALQGAQASLRIERDAQGVPTIRAASARDAYFGLGVAHAQDRLWQLETHRRIAAGRLAEAFGKSALETDRFLRALGVRGAAQAQWAQLAPDSRAALQAYAAGINAVLQDGLRARPPEFVILGIEPEPWTPIDSLGWALMMAWDLGGNWGGELLRLRLALQMPVARINELLPPYPGEQPLQTADYAALFRSLKLDGSTALSAWERLPGIAPPSGVEGVGSNNWVVAGNHTTTGTPLLANDPHLKLSTPALWVRRAPGSAGPARRRRHVAGLAGCRAGAERAHRLGLHQHRARCAGPVHRADRPARRRPLPHAGGLGALRNRRRRDPCQGPAGCRDQRAPHAARAGDFRRRHQRRHPGSRRQAALRAGLALDRTGRRQRRAGTGAGAAAGRFRRRLLQGHARLGGADAEHGGGRQRRPHRG